MVGHNCRDVTCCAIAQAETLTLSSRAFHNNVYGPYCKYITEFFGCAPSTCKQPLRTLPGDAEGFARKC